MILAMGVSYITFIILRYIPSSPSFFRAFIMKWCWILSKAFSVLIGIIMWFLSLPLLICVCKYTNIYPWIAERNPAWL
jgi:hypothetical protein